MPVNIVQKKTQDNFPKALSLGYVDKFEVHATQTAQILKTLLSGQTLSVREAGYEFGIFCLASLIQNLKKRKIDVKKTLVQRYHPSGRVSEYARYYIAPSEIARINAQEPLP